MRYLIFCVFLIGCGGDINDPFPAPIPDPEPGPYSEPNCGNNICEPQYGENYWNCIDCVDPLTGGPKDGFCGDGICYNETMTSCFTDCRPRQVKSGGFELPEPKPIPPKQLPPIPIPDPGPKIFHGMNHGY